MRKVLISIFVVAISLSGCKTLKNSSMNDAAYQPAGGQQKESTVAKPTPVVEKPVQIAEKPVPVPERKTIDEPALMAKPDENAPKISGSAEKAIVVKTEEVTIEKPKEEVRDLFDFYVIMGSFSNGENAQNLKSELANRGNDAEILRSKSGLLRVSTLGTNNEEDARILIRKIRIETPEHSDVWLLKTQK